MLTAYAKGAPDVLLEHCDRMLVDGAVQPLNDADRMRILHDVERLSNETFRTLGSAYRPLNVTDLSDIPGIVQSDGGTLADDIADQADVVETSMIWAGMVGIIDPPRTEVRDSVAEAHAAGIRTVMITGDHPLTAVRIAKDLGIVDENRRGAYRQRA